MQKVLDNINANIFVSDYDTLKVIFANKPFREEAGEVPENAECWRMLNAGLENGCKHCPKPKLLDANRKFTGVHFWEDYNPVTKRWYTIQSMAIKWLDGRWAIMDIVVNVYDIADTAKMTEEIQSSDIFANATIVGMKPMEKESVVKDTSAFRPGLVVADAVYNPEETRLLREAKEAGCTCLNGKGMLL